jgi:hypothetical protein
MGYAILLPEIALPPIFELLSAKPREIGALESCKNLRMLLHHITSSPKRVPDEPLTAGRGRV